MVPPFSIYLHSFNEARVIFKTIFNLNMNEVPRLWPMSGFPCFPSRVKFGSGVCAGLALSCPTLVSFHQAAVALFSQFLVIRWSYISRAVCVYEIPPGALECNKFLPFFLLFSPLPWFLLTSSLSLSTASTLTLLLVFSLPSSSKIYSDGLLLSQTIFYAIPYSSSQPFSFLCSHSNL